MATAMAGSLLTGAVCAGLLSGYRSLVAISLPWTWTLIATMLVTDGKYIVSYFIIFNSFFSLKNFTNFFLFQF
jgi:hypothetical protein